MKITGYRSLSTRHEWGRPVGDVNGVSAGTTTRQDVLVITTSDGVEGVALGAHPDVERVFAVLEGEDPRSTTGLYDRMLDAVFKLGHQGPGFATIGTLDMALWDLKAKLAGEPLWRLPVAERYRDQVDLGWAVRNHPLHERGRAITAALFLGEFVERAQPWVHLDVAGPAWRGDASVEGATGFGVRTLLQVARSMEGPDRRG